MATVAQAPTTRKAPKAFYAHLYEEAGILSRIDGALTFFADSGTITTVEPADCMWLTVLGEVGVAECQHLADVRHGGCAKIATTRRQEVA